MLSVNSKEAVRPAQVLAPNRRFQSYESEILVPLCTPDIRDAIKLSGQSFRNAIAKITSDYVYVKQAGGLENRYGPSKTEHRSFA